MLALHSSRHWSVRLVALPQPKEYIDILKSWGESARGWIRRDWLRGIDVAKKQEARRGGRDLWRGHGFYWREQAHRTCSLFPESPRQASLPWEKVITPGNRKTNDHSQRAPRRIAKRPASLCDREDQIKVCGNYFFSLETTFPSKLHN